MSAKSALLVHGAGGGPWSFDGWATSLPELVISIPDLHEGVDVARASMNDYAARVVFEGRALPHPLALIGWSMGGLVAMMAAARLRSEFLVLIEASPPREVQGSNHDVHPAPGVFEYKGRFRSRPESRYARDERHRGISVPAVPDRTLVICGMDYAMDRGRMLAERYGTSLREFPSLRHWELVSDRDVRAEIRDFTGLPKRSDLDLG